MAVYIPTRLLIETTMEYMIWCMSFIKFSILTYTYTFNFLLTNQSIDGKLNKF